ncbi:uncharacterized protein [Apostichopus japonicus]|uniref:uncharacterized protein n=1 Tax=Stichopus japonicus TaxID=307972 RepID=UPI003AB862CA
MPFTLMKPDVCNIQALFGLQQIQLKHLKPDDSLINRFLKLTLYKDWGVKWVGTTPRRKIVFLESGPLSDQKINAYCIGQYAKDFSAVNVGDVVFVANATIQKSSTFSKDMIHPCQLVFSSESNPDIWSMPKNTSASASTTATTHDKNTTAGNAAPTPATLNGGTVDQNQQSALFKDLYNYRYTPLKDVKVTRGVDVYGVVKFFKPPYKTSGADYCTMITIVDPSIDAQVSGLKCLIFNSDLNAMPKVLDVGNIVRFHRLKVIVFRDELQGQKSPGFSCLVFDGSPEAPMEPRSTTTNYTISELDKEKVKELRTWSKESGFLSERLKLTLSMVTEGQHFDLICQVIAVSVSSQHGCVNLKVWDGTKCKLSSFHIDTYQLDEERQAEVDRVGALAVDIFVNGQHEEFAKSVSPGDFVRFYNLYTSTGGSQQQGKVNPKVMFVLLDGTLYGRGMVRLNRNSAEVRALMRKLETAVEDALLAEAEVETDGTAQSAGPPSHLQQVVSVEVHDPPVMTLSKVRASQYFDLTCQVIKTVEMSDISCVCINVWDGTKMNLPCRKMDCTNYSVSMIPGLAETAGPMAEDICLYDNHMENGRKIKPGNFVKVTNLHAPRYPPLPRKGAVLPPMGSTKVELVLHKGVTFGKNVQILSPDSPLVVPLKRRLDALLGKIPGERTIPSDRGNEAGANARNERSKDSTREDKHGEDGGGPSKNGDKDANRRKRDSVSEELRCMQRFASFTVNCERIKFVSISEAKGIQLPNKFRVKAKVTSFVPADVRDFVHVRCPACNHRCGLSFLKDFPVKKNHTIDEGNKSSRRHSPRRRKLRPPGSKVEGSARTSEEPGPRSSMRIKARQQRMSQQAVEANEGKFTEAATNEKSPSKSTKRKQAEDSPESTASGMTLRSSTGRSPKRARRGESLSDSQSSNDYVTASQSSTLSSQPETQTLHQRLKVIQLEGKYGTVEVNNVSARDVITLCKNGLKLSQPPQACLKYVPLSSPEPGIKLLCPRCCPDTSNGRKILMNYEYLFKLNLEDNSDSIEVIVQGDQATKFLNGLEPDNLYKDESQRNRLARIMEVIESKTDSDQSSLECCIKGHTMVRHKESHRIYQLVDTLLSSDLTEV